MQEKRVSAVQLWIYTTGRNGKRGFSMLVRQWEHMSLYIPTCNYATLLALLDLCHIKHSFADIQLEASFTQVLFEATSRCTVHQESPERVGISTYRKQVTADFVHVRLSYLQKLHRGEIRSRAARSRAVDGVMATGVFVRKLKFKEVRWKGLCFTDTTCCQRFISKKGKQQHPLLTSNLLFRTKVQWR